MKSLKRFFSSGPKKTTSDYSVNRAPFVIEFNDSAPAIGDKRGHSKAFKPNKIGNFFVRSGRLPETNSQQQHNAREYSPSRRYGLIEPIDASNLSTLATTSTLNSTSSTASVYWDFDNGDNEHARHDLRRDASREQLASSAGNPKTAITTGAMARAAQTDGHTAIQAGPQRADAMGNIRGRRLTKMPGSWPQRSISVPDLVPKADLVGPPAWEDWWSPKEGELPVECQDDYVMSWSNEERWLAMATDMNSILVHRNSILVHRNRKDSKSMKAQCGNNNIDEWWLNNDAESSQTCRPLSEANLTTNGTKSSNNTVTSAASTNPFKRGNTSRMSSFEIPNRHESLGRTEERAILNKRQNKVSQNVSNQQNETCVSGKSPLSAKITRTCDICTEVYEFTPVSSIIRSTFPNLTKDCCRNHSPPSHCLTCLNTWFETSLSSSITLEFNCPHPSCNVQLSYHDISKFARKDIFQLYDERLKLKALGELETWQNCLHAGCGFGQDHIGGEDGPIMTCLKCGERTCISCQCIMHDGLTCAQNQRGITVQDVKRKEVEEVRRKEMEEIKKEEKRRKGRLKAEIEKRKKEQEGKKKLEKIEAKKMEKRAAEARVKAVKENEAWIWRETKPCPGEKCGKRIHKDGGCDHMTCLACRHQFCWLCLAPYDAIRKQGNKMHRITCAHYA